EVHEDGVSALLGRAGERWVTKSDRAGRVSWPGWYGLLPPPHGSRPRYLRIEDDGDLRVVVVALELQERPTDERPAPAGHQNGELVERDLDHLVRLPQLAHEELPGEAHQVGDTPGILVAGVGEFVRSRALMFPLPLLQSAHECNVIIRHLRTQ